MLREEPPARGCARFKPGRLQRGSFHRSPIGVRSRAARKAKGRLLECQGMLENRRLSAIAPIWLRIGNQFPCAARSTAHRLSGCGGKATSCLALRHRPPGSISPSVGEPHHRRHRPLTISSPLPISRSERRTSPARPPGKPAVARAFLVHPFGTNQAAAPPGPVGQRRSDPDASGWWKSVAPGVVRRIDRTNPR
jgi:hypothetical protein